MELHFCTGHFITVKSSQLVLQCVKLVIATVVCAWSFKCISPA